MGIRKPGDLADAVTKVQKNLHDYDTSDYPEDHSAYTVGVDQKSVRVVLEAVQPLIVMDFVRAFVYTNSGQGEHLTDETVAAFLEGLDTLQSGRAVWPACQLDGSHTGPHNALNDFWTGEGQEAEPCLPASVPAGLCWSQAPTVIEYNPSIRCTLTAGHEGAHTDGSATWNYGRDEAVPGPIPPVLGQADGVVGRLQELVSTWNGYSHDLKQRAVDVDNLNHADRRYVAGQSVAWRKAADKLAEILLEGGLG